MALKVPKDYKFYVTNNDPLVNRMILKRGHSLTQDLNKANIMLFPGGPDVMPLLYGEKPMDCTNFNLTRDLKETKIYRRGRSLPKIGICRGAQFLCVMAGGSLWQDVNNHLENHDVYNVRTNSSHRVTSTHHQMMIPPPHARVLAWAGEATRRVSMDCVVRLKEELGEPRHMQDPEVVFLKDEKALCFQPHPEYSCQVTHDFFWDLVETFVFTRVN